MLRDVMVLMRRRLGQRRLKSGARRPLAGLCLVLLAAVACGCAGSKKDDIPIGPISGVPAPQPPVFLTGPMALLLTNTDGFRAHAVLEGGGAPGSPALASGELMGRGSKLLFAPGVDPAAGKHSHTQESAFIWDVSTNCGFILNEPLQAYAPMSTSRQFTNLVAGPAMSRAAQEKIAGHACESSDVTVTAADGTATTLRVWRATDLKGLALRISNTSDAVPLTLTLSNVQLGSLPVEAFMPPSGFTRYTSAEALINELVARQMNYKRGPTYHGEEMEPGAARDMRQPTRPN